MNRSTRALNLFLWKKFFVSVIYGDNSEKKTTLKRDSPIGVLTEFKFCCVARWWVPFSDFTVDRLPQWFPEYLQHHSSADVILLWYFSLVLASLQNQNVRSRKESTICELLIRLFTGHRLCKSTSLRRVVWRETSIYFQHWTKCLVTDCGFTGSSTHENLSRRPSIICHLLNHVPSNYFRADICESTCLWFKLITNNQTSCSNPFLWWTTARKTMLFRLTSVRWTLFSISTNDLSKNIPTLNFLQWTNCFHKYFRSTVAHTKSRPIVECKHVDEHFPCWFLSHKLLNIETTWHRNISFFFCAAWWIPGSKFVLKRGQLIEMLTSSVGLKNER